MIPGDIPPLAPAIPAPYGLPQIPGATTDPSSSVPSLPAPGFGTPSAMYNPPSGVAPLIPVPAATEPNETRAAAEEWSAIERRAAFFEKEFGYRPFGSRVQQAGFTTR